jgi:hypothetical protein
MPKCFQLGWATKLGLGRRVHVGLRIIGKSIEIVSKRNW